ncbi:hypothetical protein K8Q98_03250 [Candidatus Nomurabacteria bacterium]|nr:hypothetical protein [Candidatus Nomurabacteria bacterium]
MKKIIHHVRKQPEEVKRHILHLVTFFFGVVLVMFWFYSMGTTFTNSEVEQKAERELQPFSVLKNNIVNGYESIYGDN